MENAWSGRYGLLNRNTNVVVQGVLCSGTAETVEYHLTDFAIPGQKKLG